MCYSAVQGQNVNLRQALQYATNILCILLTSNTVIRGVKWLNFVL